MNPVLLAVLIGIGLAIGDIFMEKWSLANYSLLGMSLVYLAVALLIYSISLIGYALLLKTFDLNVATLIVVALDVLIITVVGIFSFNQPLHTNAILGALFCFIGLCFLIFT